MIRRTPLKRGPAPVRRTAVRKKRATSRRVSVLRDPEYLAFLRERSCVACCILTRLATRIDAAHGPVNGRGSKGPDDQAIPLCRRHHQLQHAMGWPRFEKEYGFSREQAAAAHWTAFQLTKDTV